MVSFLGRLAFGRKKNAQQSGANDNGAGGTNAASSGTTAATTKAATRRGSFWRRSKKPDLQLSNINASSDVYGGGASSSKASTSANNNNFYFMNDATYQQESAGARGRGRGPSGDGSGNRSRNASKASSNAGGQHDKNASASGANSRHNSRKNKRGGGSTSSKNRPHSPRVDELREVDDPDSNAWITSWLSACLLECPLPVHWRRNGRGFFLNAQTNAVSVEHPLKVKFDEMHRHGLNGVDYLIRYREEVSLELEEQENIWLGPYRDPQSGEEYYANSLTRQSVWDNPFDALSYTLATCDSFLYYLYRVVWNGAEYEYVEDDEADGDQAYDFGLGDNGDVFAGLGLAGLGLEDYSLGLEDSDDDDGLSSSGDYSDDDYSDEDDEDDLGLDDSDDDELATSYGKNYSTSGYAAGGASPSAGQLEDAPERRRKNDVSLAAFRELHQRQKLGKDGSKKKHKKGTRYLKGEQLPPVPGIAALSEAGSPALELADILEAKGRAGLNKLELLGLAWIKMCTEVVSSTTTEIKQQRSHPRKAQHPQQVKVARKALGKDHLFRGQLRVRRVVAKTREQQLHQLEKVEKQLRHRLGKVKERLHPVVREQRRLQARARRCQPQKVHPCREEVKVLLYQEAEREPRFQVAKAQRSLAARVQHYRQVAAREKERAKAKADQKESQSSGENGTGSR
ncbi:unnamed protein product [Amoebophrya sp. A25]|nr:unnamed protein product [Amoebophrya sp. A25]|eukprot:GSA25T00008274001.1